MMYFVRGLNRCCKCHEGCCTRCLLELLPPPTVAVTAEGANATTFPASPVRRAIENTAPRKPEQKSRACPFCAASPYRTTFTGRLSRDAWQLQQAEARRVAKEERQLLERAMDEEHRRVEAKRAASSNSAGATSLASSPQPGAQLRVPTPQFASATVNPPAGAAGGATRGGGVGSSQGSRRATPQPPASIDAELDNELLIAAQLSLDHDEGPTTTTATSSARPMPQHCAWRCPECGWLNYRTVACRRSTRAEDSTPVEGREQSGGCTFRRRPWPCRECTYENAAVDTVCAMCQTRDASITH